MENIHRTVTPDVFETVVVAEVSAVVLRWVAVVTVLMVYITIIKIL